METERKRDSRGGFLLGVFVLAAMVAVGKLVRPTKLAPPTLNQDQAPSIDSVPLAHAARQKRSWDGVREWLRLGIETFGLLGLIATFIISAKSLQLVEEGLKVSRNASDAAVIAAKAAEESATSAKASAVSAAEQVLVGRDANAVARSNLSETQRANLLARENARARLSLSVGVEQEPTTEKPTLGFAMPVVITGTTDATKVRFASKLSMVSGGASTYPMTADELAFIDLRDIGVVSNGEQNRILRTSIQMGKPSLDGYLTGTLFARLIVRVEYCDAFGRRHHLVRCAFRDVKRPPGVVSYCGVDIDDNVSDQVDATCK